MECFHVAVAVLLLENFLKNNQTEEAKLHLGKIRINEDAKANSSLFQYVIVKDFAQVAEFLLANGFDVDEKFADGSTPLSFAVEQRARNTLKVFVRSAELDKFDDFNSTALMNSAWFCFEDMALELLKAGAFADVKGKCGMSAAHFAAVNNCVQVMRLLLNADRLVMSIRDNSGKTPLMLAAMYGYFPMIDLLLSYYPWEDPEDKWGYTAAMYAVESGSRESVRLLLAYRGNCDVESPDVQKLEKPKLNTNDLEIVLLVHSFLKNQRLKKLQSTQWRELRQRLIREPFRDEVGRAIPNSQGRFAGTMFDLTREGSKNVFLKQNLRKLDEMD